ncbi:MAG: polysaccharide biosynthesis C-terminal domain-containing protein [Bacteroidia bacterium]|nr:polysaccharide biosynthesis C-terminal domain-containing protein [Bacteroidia bacterium]
MGIIIRQSAKGTVFAYLGVILGLLISGFLLPKYLTAEENGVRTLFITYSVLFQHLANLGMVNVIIRFFPYFRNPSNFHNGFFRLIIIIASLGILCAITVFFIVKPLIIMDSADKSALFIQYIYYLIPLIIFTSLFNIFDAYINVLYDSVIGTSQREFVLRIFVIIAILLFYFKILDFSGFVVAWVTAQSLPTVIMAVILMFRKQFYFKQNPGFVTKEMKKSMTSVASYALITTFSVSLLLYIDTLMVNSMLDLKATGIYGITFFFGSIIIIPARSVMKISSILLADAWKENKPDIVNTIYSKSCLNQLIIGLFIFIGVWVNIDNIFEILPIEYEAGKYVIFFISLSFLFESASGVSSALLATSEYYRATTFLLIILIVITILTNYFLIPIWGITGAAIATAISRFLFNFIRYIFINRKLRMQPYNYKFLIIISIALITYFAGFIIPNFENLIIDIIIRSMVIVIFFPVMIYLSDVSEDITAIGKKYFQIVQNWIKLS